MSKKTDTKTAEPAEPTIDSLGQANPAQDLERKNIAEKNESAEEQEKEAAKKGH